MCKKGDIILIKEYKDGKNLLGRHSFVVIDDLGGQVCGLTYDLVALVMSSFKSERHKEHKMKYPGNFEITASHKQMQSWANDKSGYIKTEQFYYFDKKKLDYRVIGSLTEEAWDTLVEFIEALSERGVDVQIILDNLS